MVASSLIRKPSAFLPLVMSALALTVVLGYLGVNGPAPQRDEGAAAHVWQLLMAAQLPLVLLFAFRWLPEEPRQGFVVVVLQVVAAAAALLPVYLLEW